MMRRAIALPLLLALVGCKTFDPTGDLWDRLKSPLIAEAGEQQAVGALALPPEKREPMERNYPRTPARTIDHGKEFGRIGAKFDGIPLDEVVRSVMAEVFQANVLIEPGEYPSVSWTVEKPLPREELMRQLQLLATQAKARLFLADDVYHLTHDVPDSANQRIIRLKHRMPREFMAFGAGDGPVRVIPDDASRQLVLSGQPAAVVAVAQTIMDLDVPAFDGVVFRWMPVREARAVNAVVDRVGPLSVTSFPFGEGILMTGPDNDVRRVEKLVSMLQEHGESTAFVYETHSIEPRICQELATGGRTDDAGGSGGGAAARGALPAPAPGGRAGSGPAPFLDSGAPLTPMSGIQALNPQPTRLNVTVLEGRCVIRGARADVTELLEVLRMVDRPAIRIDFQAALFEVKLTDELRYGVRTFLSRGRYDPNGVQREQVRLSDVGAITDVLSKVPGGVAVLPISDWRIAIDALRGKTAVNVLAEPSADVDAGQEVKLQVGDQVPVVTSTSQSADTGRVNSQISYRDVGVILKIKPTVRAGGMLQLVVSMEVSDALRTTVSTVDSPTIQRRGIDTTVTVLNGQTVLLGGLLRESGQDGKNGLPLVSDIPVFGNLFSQTSQTRERQELALMITPRIVDEAAISTKAKAVMQRIAELRLGKL